MREDEIEALEHFKHVIKISRNTGHIFWNKVLNVLDKDTEKMKKTFSARFMDV